MVNSSTKYSEYNPRRYEIHQLALERVPTKSTVLELGCATGYITNILHKKNCVVTCVEIDKASASLAKPYAHKLFIANLNEPSTIPIKSSFEVVLCMDVIEHLTNRKKLLSWVNKRLKFDGILILSTPNIAHIRIRMNLLWGNFTYEPIGIMDETHVHFYTKDTLTQELSLAGFAIEECIGSADLGQIPFFGRLLRYLPKSFQFFIVSINPNLLAVQWLIVARPIR